MKPCVFPCKVALAGDASYLLCATVAAAVVSTAIGSSSMFCNEWLFMCACFYAFVQIAVYTGCMNVAWGLCWGESRSTKPCVFPCKVASAGDGRYLLCATGAVAVVSTAIGFSSVFCNEWLFMCACFFAFVDFVVADRIVLAAARLLGATAACVMHLSFAAGHRKSYWNGCIKAATMICQQIFSILALLSLLLNFYLKSASKSFFWLWRRDPVLELQFLTRLHVVLLCLATEPVQIAL